MIYQTTYRAASSVSEIVEKHFSEHFDSVCKDNTQLPATKPTSEIIEAIIDAAFWASLRKEEGHSPKISIAYLSPEQAEDPLLFETKLPLNANILTKLAPGLERPGIHLGVWKNGEELYLWGTTLKIPNLCYVVDVSEPGLLVIKHRRICGFGKYTNVAVLKGDQVKIVDDKIADSPDCPPVLKALLDLSAPPAWNDPVNVLIQLAVSMRAHKHGGALLVVPSGSQLWRSSIVHPMQYSVSPVFSGLTNLVGQEDAEREDGFWRGVLSREVEHIAGLTAVDGATIISDQHELLAFGAKIVRSDESTAADKIKVIEPIFGIEETVIHPGQIGGTRHLSAAQFVYDQRDAFAFVASQDGHFTVMTWSKPENMLMAYRIDTLLL